MTALTISVVSGLPRSGTSMVMQMLRAGGVSVLEDGARTADDDNPRGYLEDARTMRLWDDTSWLPEAVGMAVKIVCPLLVALPFDFDYRVILIERDLVEVMASQATMLRRRGEDHRSLASFPELIQMLDLFKAWVRYQPNFSCLSLGYREVLDAPADAAARIEVFLGQRLDRRAMADAVEPALHRQHRS